MRNFEVVVVSQLEGFFYGMKLMLEKNTHLLFENPYSIICIYSITHKNRRHIKYMSLQNGSFGIEYNIIAYYIKLHWNI